MKPESMDTDLETAPAATSSASPPPRTVPVVLVMLTMLVPLAINLYLPVLPEIAAVFGVGVPRIQVSLGVFLLGLAVGQFGGAPIADRYGRRVTALSGTAIFAAATVGILPSASADQFIALRAVQGVGAGVAFVNVGAVVGDLFDHRAGGAHAQCHQRDAGDPAPARPCLRCGASDGLRLAIDLPGSPVVLRGSGMRSLVLAPGDGNATRRVAAAATDPQCDSGLQAGVQPRGGPGICVLPRLLHRVPASSM